MSLPSDNKDDMIEEEITVKKPKKKRRSRKKKPKIKICKTCGQDILENERRDMFMFHDTYHQLKTKEYCDKHEDAYNDHKCKPAWCGDCGYLRKYEIIIDWEKKNKRW
tara:strand:+ start:289 stop:612 length:324 start_codon:yes stop_codon:yes gene_type:complete